MDFLFQDVLKKWIYWVIPLGAILSICQFACKTLELGSWPTIWLTVGIVSLFVIATLFATPYAKKAALDRAILVGRWHIKKESRDYDVTWIFSADGTATVEMAGRDGYVDRGLWKFSSSCVHITWESLIPESRKHCWETFNRPLRSRNVSGRSWEDDQDGALKNQGCVRGSKIG